MVSICIKLHIINDTIGTMDITLIRIDKIYFKQLFMYQTVTFILLFINWVNWTNYTIYTASSTTVTFAITRDISNIIIVERLVLYQNNVT